MTGDHIYAYGIIEAEELELQVDGVEDAERVFTVEHGEIAALVSAIDTTQPERTTENMEAHDAVLRAALDGGERTVVPMSFGMAFRDERTLENVLDGGKQAFETALDDVSGTVELGVKVVTETPANAPAAGGSGLAGAPDGSSRIDRQSVEETVSERLEQHSLGEVENGLFSDRLILNNSYLVRNADREAFNRAIGELEEELDGVQIQYTGPFAPYNFVDIEIGAAQ